MHHAPRDALFKSRPDRFPILRLTVPIRFALAHFTPRWDVRFCENCQCRTDLVYVTRSSLHRNIEDINVALIDCYVLATHVEDDIDRLSSDTICFLTELRHALIVHH